MKTVSIHHLFTLPVSVPWEMIEQLDAEAERQGLLRGRSHLIRLAIREYLDRRVLSPSDKDETNR